MAMDGHGRAYATLLRVFQVVPALLAPFLVLTLAVGSYSPAAAASTPYRYHSTAGPASYAYDSNDLVAAGRVSGSAVPSARPLAIGGACGRAQVGPLGPSASFVAAEADSGLVNLASPSRTSHILDGEVRPNGTFGGGHRSGTGFPKKSEFPSDWSDAQIMHNISDVATDPAIAWRAGVKPGDFWANGTRDGIDIEVLMRNNEIWTGYPTNVLRNP